MTDFTGVIDTATKLTKLNTLVFVSNTVLSPVISSKAIITTNVQPILSTAGNTYITDTQGQVHYIPPYDPNTGIVGG